MSQLLLISQLLRHQLLWNVLYKAQSKCLNRHKIHMSRPAFVEPYWFEISIYNSKTQARHPASPSPCSAWSQSLLQLQGPLCCCCLQRERTMSQRTSSLMRRSSSSFHRTEGRTWVNLIPCQAVPSPQHALPRHTAKRRRKQLWRGVTLSTGSQLPFTGWLASVASTPFFKRRGCCSRRNSSSSGSSLLVL
jgi:hypothetical protein